MNTFLGLNQDYSSNDIPEGFLPYAKNILLTSTEGAVENELGFTYSSINDKIVENDGWKNLIDDGLKPIGAISTTKYEVIWLTNNTYSVIGTYNQETDEFHVVYNDSTQPSLSLSLNHPIKAVWRENYLGEIYVAWTDNNVSPKILNITKASDVTDLKQINLFPEFLQPTINAKIESGGSLKTGTYYFFIQYETNTGIQTDYSTGTDPCYIVTDPQNNNTYSFHGNGTNVITSKRITLTITNVDTAYSTINLAVQKYNSGDTTTTYVKVLSAPVAGRSTITISYTGQEQETVLTTDEVLIKAPLYNKAKTITTLNSQLFLGNLQAEPDVPIQEYVNQWTLKWTSELVNWDDKNTLPKYSNKRTFAHDEVYAFYATLLYKNGKYSQAYHIPGRAPGPITVNGNLIQETNTMTYAKTLSGLSYLGYDEALSSPNQVKYFQTRDTCKWNSTTQEGDFGYWENENETYPDSDEWGTLRAQKVRHHKFPSNGFIKENVHTGSSYGMSQWDVLGFKIKNFSLPSEIVNTVDKIIISYAKRDYDNSIVVGQDKTAFMGFITDFIEQLSGGSVVSKEQNGYDLWYTLPLSCRMKMVFFDNGDNYYREASAFYYDNPYFGNTGIFNPDFYRLKLHCPEVVRNSAPLNGAYVKVNFKCRTITEQYSPGENIYGSGRIARGLVNSLSGTSKNALENLKVVKFNNYQYIAANLLNGNIDCKFSENGAVADIPKVWTLDGADDSNNLSIQSKIVFNFNLHGIGGETWDDEDVSSYDYFYDQKENYYHYNINKYIADVYNSFSTQDLIFCNEVPLANIPTTTIKNGDVFFDLYSYNSFAASPPHTWDDRILADADYSIRSVHNFLLESSLNIGLRYETYIGNTYFRGDSSYLTDNAILSNGNYLSINNDYNKINNPLLVVPFKDSREFANSFPHRIIKSLTVTSESKYQQWTRFLPLDYYEIQKSKGVIINLQGTVDRLLIHTERSLFYTRDKARISADVAQINLTSGEIFDFAPIEIIPTTNGYTGTQQMFSCALLPDGYFWVDSQQGKIFLFASEQPKEISMQGFFNFFADNLKQYNAINSDNTFNYDGVTVAYDNRYKRILATFKQNANTPNYKYFTMSYSSYANQGKGAWVSFHDYDPDYMFSTRKNVISFKDGKLYIHNNPTNRGLYYDDNKASSYIDVPFNPNSIPSFSNGKRVYKDTSVYLDSINWNSNFTKLNGVNDLYKTINYLTVRNQHQHSGKILLDYDTNLIKDTNTRNAETKWYCNSFRNLVKDKNEPFIKDIFSNFEVINGNIDSLLPWFEQEAMNNRWFIVRFEYDNIGDYKMILHSVDINKTDSFR